jgi:hypothetical protein
VSTSTLISPSHSVGIALTRVTLQLFLDDPS